jgi:hypothetical protein
MRANPIARPHPSRRAYAPSNSRNVFGIRAPQDEDEHRVMQGSRSQTTRTPSFPRRVFCARGFAPLLHSPRIEGWAERRETFGCSAEHPWGMPSCVKDARERAYDAACQALARRLASHDAGRSPLGAPPWRFWAPGAALPSPWAPAVLQRRAVALRIRAASSSHPGRSAWRAGSLPPEASGYEPPPQDATPRSAFRIVSGDAPR